MRRLLTALCLTPLAFAPALASAQNAPTAATSDAAIAKWVAANGEALIASIRNAQEREQQAKLRAAITSQTPTFGPANAKVTVLEFSDYQCPACVAAQPTMEALRKAYGNRVRFAFKQLPLDFHPQAEPAAKAALAAHRQGKFWEYHAQLWTNRGQLDDAKLVEIAKNLKLDLKRFNADRVSPVIAKQLEQDMRDAQDFGARGTPMFLVGGQMLPGVVPEEAFRKLLDAELAKAISQQASTTTRPAR